MGREKIFSNFIVITSNCISTMTNKSFILYVELRVNKFSIIPFKTF